MIFYHNYQNNEKSSYLTTSACQFSRYIITRLPFRVAPASDIFQRKIDIIFRVLPNVFGIVDDILIVGYDDDNKCHDRTLRQVMQVCHFNNVNLHKNECHFREDTILLGGDIKQRHTARLLKVVCTDINFPLIK